MKQTNICRLSGDINKNNVRGRSEPVSRSKTHCRIVPLAEPYRGLHTDLTMLAPAATTIMIYTHSAGSGYIPVKHGATIEVQPV